MIKPYSGSVYHSKHENSQDRHNNRALLNQRAEHNATLDALQTKLDKMNAEIQKLTELPQLSKAQQRELKSLQERIALIQGTLSRAVRTR